MMNEELVNYAARMGGLLMGCQHQTGNVFGGGSVEFVVPLHLHCAANLLSKTLSISPALVLPKCIFTSIPYFH
jgi:hypothetical protein